MNDYLLDDYDYPLPEELIAQHPPPQRDASRLLLCNCGHDTLGDFAFPEITGVLRSGDLLVFNDTRVFPARLVGRRDSGGRIELLLLHYPELVLDAPGSVPMSKPCWGMLKSSNGVRPGTRLIFGEDFQGEIIKLSQGGRVQVRLELSGGEGGSPGERLDRCLERYGHIPLPPYIRRGEDEEADRGRYQTVYARTTGAVAAPTAGLHFTRELLERIEAMGVAQARITLHVGYGTFSPVRCEDIREHLIHAEEYSIGAHSAQMINRCREQGGRIWAVGTTSVRALEAAASEDGRVEAGSGSCRLYIYPGYRFRVVDNLLTNFHLPRSSLLFLVSALAGRERILRAYAHAVEKGYRFFSYGDAMAILKKV